MGHAPVSIGSPPPSYRRVPKPAWIETAHRSRPPMIDFVREYWQLAAFLAAAAAVLYFLSRLERARPLPYEKRNRLLTDAELAFYRVLHSATAGDWPLFAMVRLADL